MIGSIGQDTWGALDEGLLSPAHYLVREIGPIEPITGQPYLDLLINDSDAYAFLWMLGLAAEYDGLDPWVFKLEAIYGAIDTGNGVLNRRGAYVAAEIDYKLDFATLALMGFWASGEDGDWSNGSEQLFWIEPEWGPTTFGFEGTNMLPELATIAESPEGKWGIMFAIQDISFIEDLKHHVRFMYGGGTNAPSSRRLDFLPPTTTNVYGYKGLNAIALPGLTFQPNGFFPGPGVPLTLLTTEDYYFEVNFDHHYKLYENLEIILELGLVDVQYGNDFYVHDDTVPALKAALGLKYKF